MKWKHISEAVNKPKAQNYVGLDAYGNTGFIFWMPGTHRWASHPLSRTEWQWFIDLDEVEPHD